MVILQLEEQPPLIQAIFSGEVDAVRKLLESKEDVNYQDFEKRSALHAAAFRGDPTITRLLIDHGARVNTKDCKWVTPLHRACYAGSDETVTILLNNAADTCARDRLWQTPLHIAAACNSLKCVSFLLDRIQNPNVTDRSGRTALHHAVLNGHNEIVDLLISRGCIVNACDKKDCRPMHWAAYKGHADTIEILLQRGADINAQDRNQYTPLHVAAASGAVSVIDVLIGNGADVEAQNAYGNTPLHVACLNGHGSFAGELLRYSADKQAANFRGQTPLHLAAASTHGVHCLNLLVNREADINRQSLDGRTPLHMTAIYGRFTRSKTLIDRGAIVDCIDNNGCTALHIAAHYGHELLSNTLLSYGASPLRKGFEGRTPLHMCCLAGYIECCRIFIKAGVDLNDRDDTGKTPLHCAAYKGAVECVDLLVSSGADFKAIDNVGRTALHYAAVQGFFFCVFTLVGIGSPVNQADQDGCTALHLAAAYDIDGRCVNYLIEHKADPKLKDAKGFTPIHYAVAGNNVNALKFLLYAVGNYALYGPEMPSTTPLHIAARNGNMEMLEKLMPYFPDPNIRNEYGCSALLLAARHGYANCVQMLLRFGAKVSICDSPNGLSPVHHSAKNGHVHCLALLVDNAEDKAVIDLADTLQRTALMLAVSNSHVDCVTTLVKSGADPNVTDGDGHSCLFRAVVTGQHNILQMLLPRSAAIVDERDVHGKTALHVAAGCGRLSCVQRLLPYMRDDCKESADKQNCTALHWACYGGSAECVAHFFNEGIFKQMEGNAFSPAHCAASVGSEKCLKLLRSRYGPEIVKLKDERSRTPLHVAALHGQCDCAKFLVAQGADVDGRDEDERTPLISAAFNGQVQVIETLIGSKANVTLYDKNGNTALHTACLRKHSNAALLLLECINDPNVINMANNERKTALHLTARNGLVGVTRQLIAKGASVTAVDSNGLTPALCCAPNPNVAQCLAIILANHTAQTAENGKDPSCTPFPIDHSYFNTDAKTSTTTLKSGRNQTLQTDITLLRDPDQFELEKMFDIKFEKTATAVSSCCSDDDVVISAPEDESSRFFIHYKGSDGGSSVTGVKLKTVKPGEEDYTLARTSALELHGSQSDTVLAPKPIYSEEDYEKMVKQDAQENYLSGDSSMAAPSMVSVSARHVHRGAGRRKSKAKELGASERRCKTLKCCDDQAGGRLESFKSRSAASVLSTFRTDCVSDFISVGRDVDTDKECAEAGVVVASSRRRMERAVDALERRMRAANGGTTPRMNRFPKSTNKRLKQQQQQQHDDSAEVTREIRTPPIERCNVCKQSLGCCTEHDDEHHNIPLETMQAAIEKVLSQKGCSTNRCLLAFLDESYELNAKNAHYIYHGMLSPRCEPYIAKCLNLSGERDVEIVENISAATTPTGEEEGAYIVRKRMPKSIASTTKTTTSKIAPLGYSSRNSSIGGNAPRNNLNGNRLEKQGKSILLLKQQQQQQQQQNNNNNNNNSSATKDNNRGEQAKIGDGNVNNSKRGVASSHGFHGNRRLRDRRSATQKCSNSSRYSAASSKLEQSNRIQKVQSENKPCVARSRKMKNFSCADVAHQDEPEINETGCGEKTTTVANLSQPFPDYLKSLTDFRHLDPLVRGDDPAGIAGNGGRVRCYSTYWCFPEVTDSGGNQESDDAGRQIPSASTSSPCPISSLPHVSTVSAIKSESAVKRARIETETTPPLPAFSAEFLRANSNGTPNDLNEMIYFNEKLIEESSCHLQLNNREEGPSRDEYELEELERLRRLDEDGNCPIENSRKSESNERISCNLERRGGVTNIKNDVQDWCEDLQQFFTNSRRKQLAEDADRLAEAEKINVDDWKRFAAKDLQTAARYRTVDNADKCGAKSEKSLSLRDNKRAMVTSSEVTAGTGEFDEKIEVTDDPDTPTAQETSEYSEMREDDQIEVHYDNRITSMVSSEYCVERRYEEVSGKDVADVATWTVSAKVSDDVAHPDRSDVSERSGAQVEEVSILNDIPTLGGEEHLVKSTVLNEHSEAFLEQLQVSRKQASEMAPLNETTTTSNVSRCTGSNRRILIRKTDDTNDDHFIMKKPARSSETTRRRRDEKAINWKLYMAHRCLQLSDNMNADDYVRSKASRKRGAPQHQQQEQQSSANHQCLLHRKNNGETKGDFRRKRSNEDNDNLKTSFRYSGLKFEEYEGTVKIDELIEKENVDKGTMAARKVNFAERVYVLNDKATVYALGEDEGKRMLNEKENLDEWFEYIEEGSTRKVKDDEKMAEAAEDIDKTRRKEERISDFVDLPKKLGTKSFLETIDIKDFVSPSSDSEKKSDIRIIETLPLIDTTPIEGNDNKRQTVTLKDPSKYMKEFIDIDLELDKLEEELNREHLKVEEGPLVSKQEDELNLREMYDFDFAWRFENKMEDEGFVEDTDNNHQEHQERQPFGENYFCDIAPGANLIDEEEPEDPLEGRVNLDDISENNSDKRDTIVAGELEEIVEENVFVTNPTDYTDCCFDQFSLLEDLIERGTADDHYPSNEERPYTKEETVEETQRIVADAFTDQIREETTVEEYIEEVYPLETISALKINSGTEGLPQDANIRPLLCLDRCDEDTFPPEGLKGKNDDEVDDYSEEHAQSDISSRASEDDDLNMMDSGFSHVVKVDEMGGLSASGGDNNQQFSDRPDGRFSADSLDEDLYDASIDRRRSSYGGEGEGEETRVAKVTAEDDEPTLTTSCEKSDEYQDANLTDGEEEEANESVFYDTESDTSLASNRAEQNAGSPAHEITSLIKIDIQEHLDKIVAEKCTGTISALHGSKKNASQKSVHFKFGAESDEGADGKVTDVVPVEFEEEPKSWASLSTIYHVERENPQGAAFIESNSDMNCLHGGSLLGSKKLIEKISLVEGVADSELSLGTSTNAGDAIDKILDEITNPNDGDSNKKNLFDSSTKSNNSDSSVSQNLTVRDAYDTSSNSKCDLGRLDDGNVSSDTFPPSASISSSCKNSKLLNTNVTIVQVVENLTVLAYHDHHRANAKEETEDVEMDTPSCSKAEILPLTLTDKIDEICEEIKIEKEDYDELCRGVHLTQCVVDELEQNQRASGVVKDLPAENSELTKRQVGVVSSETKKTVKINRNVKIDDTDEYVLLDDKRASSDTGVISLNTDDLLFLSYLNGSDDNLPLRLVNLGISNSVGNLLGKGATPADDVASHHSSDNEFY